MVAAKLNHPGVRGRRLAQEGNEILVATERRGVFGAFLSQDLIGFNNAHDLFVAHLAQRGGQERHHGGALARFQIAHAESAMFRHVHRQIGPADALGRIVEGETHLGALRFIKGGEKGGGGGDDLIGWPDCGGPQLTRSEGHNRYQENQEPKNRVVEKCERLRVEALEPTGFAGSLSSEKCRGGQGEGWSSVHNSLRCKSYTPLVGNVTRTSSGGRSQPPRLFDEPSRTIRESDGKKIKPISHESRVPVRVMA